MKNRIFFLVLVCTLLFSSAALADAAYINGKTAELVHLRKDPSKDSESLGLFYTGAKVAAAEERLNDEWVRVSIGALDGYIMGEYLQSEMPECEKRIAKVSASSVNFRAKPTKESKVMKVLQQNERMTVWGHTANDWYYIEIDDGAVGYVMPAYTSMAAKGMAYASDIKQVGETHNGYLIFSYTAPNGQTLYFTGMDDPFVKAEDVNFDGHDDLVFTIIHGASNFFVEFFVWNGTEYVRAANHATDHGIVNYSLLPDQKMVLSNAANGFAGALHENILFRWEGTDLTAVRRAVSEEYEVSTDTENGFTISYDNRILNVRVWDYQNGVEGGELIYEAQVNMDDIADSDSYSQAFSGEKEAFWRGIK